MTHKVNNECVQVLYIIKIYYNFRIETNKMHIKINKRMQTFFDYF